MTQTVADEAPGAPVIKDGYDPALTNIDLAPLTKQSWSSYNIFAFWMSDVHSVGGYVTAGSLFALGIASWQVLIALIAGIVIVQVFANLVAKPSQVAGVPFPVIKRHIFGVTGARTLNVDYQSPLKRAMMGLDYGFRRRGPMTMAPSQLGLFAKSSPDYSTANIEFHVQPLSLDRFGEPMHPYPAITVSVCNLRPESRGSSHAVSADPRAAPVIQPNYLSALADQRVAVDSIRLTRRLAAAPTLARYAPQELKPGANLQSDDELMRAAGEVGTTIFHPVGTAKMGLAQDPMAVVDERLRVHGLKGLRVADASAMPRITSGNTGSPTMMIAEKAAEMILADARRA